MPASRSAKEICREDPTSISCKVATKREARRKRFEEQYAEPETEEPEEVEEAESPEPSDEVTEAPKPDPVKERQKYLDELEKEVGS